MKSTKVYVRFGEPILLSALSEEERKHIDNYTEEKVLSMIRDLKEIERREREAKEREAKELNSKE